MLCMFLDSKAPIISSIIIDVTHHYFHLNRSLTTPSENCPKARKTILTQFSLRLELLNCEFRAHNGRNSLTLLDLPRGLVDWVTSLKRVIAVNVQTERKFIQSPKCVNFMLSHGSYSSLSLYAHRIQSRLTDGNWRSRYSIHCCRL